MTVWMIGVNALATWLASLEIHGSYMRYSFPSLQSQTCFPGSRSVRSSKASSLANACPKIIYILPKNTYSHANRSRRQGAWLQMFIALHFGFVYASCFKTYSPSTMHVSIKHLQRGNSGVSRAGVWCPPGVLCACSQVPAATFHVPDANGMPQPLTTEQLFGGKKVGTGGSGSAAQA